MGDVTRMLQAVENGDPKAAEELLPIVYQELRQLAAQKLAHEKPGQTLQATALVHEAWLRLVHEENRQYQDSRHFIFAAAQAMQRILVENARRKLREKRGGGLIRDEGGVCDIPSPMPSENLLALDEALGRLAAQDPPAAQLVQLRFFAGLTQAQAAEILGLSERTASRLWAYARAWLNQEIQPV